MHTEERVELSEKSNVHNSAPRVAAYNESKSQVSKKKICKFQKSFHSWSFYLTIGPLL
jgi:hypothetical protein